MYKTRATRLAIVLLFLVNVSTLLAQAPQRGQWQSRDPLKNSLEDVNKFDPRGEFGGGVHASVTIGIDGLPIIAYRKQIASGEETIGDLEVIHCGNAECTSGNTITTIDPLAGYYASIIIGGDGLPVIAYVDGGTIPERLKVAKCGSVDCSVVSSIVHVETRFSSSPSITLDLDGLPIISYGARISTAHLLHLAKCGDAGCNNVTGSTGFASAPISGDTSIAIGADGHPLVSFHDASTGALKVVHCEVSGTSACSNSQISVIDGGQDIEVGYYNSLTIGDDGLPLIAYDGRAEVRVAHCGTPSCDAGNNISQIPGTSRSGFIANTIGVEGLPRISFVQEGRSLMTVQCGNNDCSSTDAYHTVVLTDPSFEAIEDGTSIAIGSDGLPIIAYSAGNQKVETVRVAHCGSDRCLPFWIRR